MFSRASRTVTSLSRLPFLTYRSGMKVMLLNDTSLSPHVGSLAVSAVLDHLISRAGGEITHRVYVTEQGELWRGAAADSIRTRGAITDFGRTSEGRRRDFERCIHSLRRIGRRLWGTFHDLKRELNQSPFEKRINHHYRERMWLGRYITACAPDDPDKRAVGPFDSQIYSAERRYAGGRAPLSLRKRLRAATCSAIGSLKQNEIRRSDVQL